jgi:hypothetical protein
MSVIEAAKQEIMSQLRAELPVLIHREVEKELKRRDDAAAANRPVRATPDKPAKPDNTSK